jgi:hypothetical protein
MTGPMLRPPVQKISEDGFDGPSGTTAPPSAYLQRKRKVRPGWKSTIVRADTFARLQAVQKSTIDPTIDLSYLTDACLQIALEIGSEAIVQRALDAMRPARNTP